MSFCTEFGFDENRIRRRLTFLYLSKSDTKHAQRLQQEVIIPNVDNIIEQFYDILTFQPESRRILTSGGLIERLKKTQRDYLLSLGVNFDSQVYFEERLRIGFVHAQVGLSLSVYQCSYRALTQIILESIPTSISEDLQAYNSIIKFLYKISCLDMTLAMETYHGSQINYLEEKVTRISSRVGELRVKASTDSLTGLLNHENSFRYLEKAVNTAGESQHSLSVMMADLDYFKCINDNYGHMVGDSVLQEVTARILASVRGPDVVGRYGGEEFLIILADADVETANRIAERIRLRIASTPINVEGELIEITISLGVSTMSPEDDVRSLVKRADEALYAAKDAGRNCIINF